MKKTYQTPTARVFHVQGKSIFAGSLGDISKVTISDSQTIESGDDFGVKESSFPWDGDFWE